MIKHQKIWERKSLSTCFSGMSKLLHAKIYIPTKCEILNKLNFGW